MNCYRPTMLTQTRNNADDNDDNNNDGRSFGVCEDYDSQNDDDDDDCDDGVHHAHVSFSHRQISRHGDTIWQREYNQLDIIVNSEEDNQNLLNNNQKEDHHTT